MSNVLAKIGDFDNVSLYEHYCDTTADLANIPKEEIVLGSTAIVVNGDSGFEAYIANSEKEWIPIASSSGDEGGVVPEGSLNITANGKYDVTEKAEVNVNVPNPSTGSIEIIRNGTYNVTNLASAVVNVPTSSGGSTVDVYKPVRFLDYDGTVVKSYTVEEFAALEAMPENPNHRGDEIPLIAQGWNWSRSNAKMYVAKYGALDVGQMYIPTDGKTHIKIYIDPDTPANRRVMTLRWAQNVANGVTVDWGDGTEPESFSNMSVATHDHTYTMSGWYDITLTVTNGHIAFDGSSNTSIVGQNTGTNTYKNSLIRAVYFGAGLNVGAIGNSSFANCYSLTSISIPNGVTNIGDSSFNNCYSLTSITIPKSVTRVGGSAFYNCYGLATVTFPVEVTSIGSGIFGNCRSLATVTIPSEITNIWSGLFNGCSSLTKVVIPERITSIGNNTFSGCSSLTNITIPDDVTYFGSSAFNNCYSLTGITIPDEVTSIGDNTFYNCYSLTNITIPAKVTYIGSNAFYDCYSLTSIMIQSEATTIGTSAFQNCYSLTGIIIPIGVNSIGNGMFSTCSSLTKITVPDGVTSVGGYAFRNCYSVSEYHFLPTTPPTIQSDTFFNIASDCIIYVPAASVEDYKVAANWSALADKIQPEP